MFRILQKVLLTTLFAAFASQASAMFTQPDWLDPDQPGVGTNRYAYSFNDPVNKIDPNGTESWDLFRSQEESDRANEEAAKDAMERAERIRERETLLDRYLDDLGRDDYWEDGGETRDCNGCGKSSRADWGCACCSCSWQ